jgi:hypothetical protein
MRYHFGLIVAVVKSELFWWDKIVDLFLLAITVPLLVALLVSRGIVRAGDRMLRLARRTTRVLARALLFMLKQMRSSGLPLNDE